MGIGMSLTLAEHGVLKPRRSPNEAIIDETTNNCRDGKHHQRVHENQDQHHLI
jgi:hypothetical protein